MNDDGSVAVADAMPLLVPGISGDQQAREPSSDQIDQSRHGAIPRSLGLNPRFTAVVELSPFVKTRELPLIGDC
jgi:hypothetical protein